MHLWNRNHKHVVGSTRQHLSSSHGRARLLFCIEDLLERVRGTARRFVIQCWSNPISQKVLSKPLWPLCSYAAVFTLAPLALNTSRIFLTLGSSRLTRGHVNSEPLVSRDQSTHCLFGPAPCVCWCVVVRLCLLKPTDSTSQTIFQASKTIFKVALYIYLKRMYVKSRRLKVTIVVLRYGGVIVR